MAFFKDTPLGKPPLQSPVSQQEADLFRLSGQWEESRLWILTISYERFFLLCSFTVEAVWPPEGHFCTFGYIGDGIVSG